MSKSWRKYWEDLDMEARKYLLDEVNKKHKGLEISTSWSKEDNFTNLPKQLRNRIISYFTGGDAD